MLAYAGRGRRDMPDRVWDADPELHKAAAAEREHHRQARPNGHDRDEALHLISFQSMQPRLGDAYLVKHLLGSTAMAVLYGESGSGKTFLALHLAVSIAAGIEFFG